MSGAAIASAQDDAFQSSLVADNYVPDGAYVADIATANALTNQVTCPVPDGIREGDIIFAYGLAFPDNTESSGTLSISGAWTDLQTAAPAITGRGYAAAHRTWYRVVGANPDPTEQVVLSNSDTSTFRMFLSLVRVVGADTADPFVDEALVFDEDVPATSPYSVVMPTITAEADGVYVAAIVAFADGNFSFSDGDPTPSGFVGWNLNNGGAASGEINWGRSIAFKAELSSGDVSPVGDVAFGGSAGTPDYGVGVLGGVALFRSPSGTGFTVTPLFFWDLF
jgi:hypothetical protein